ncbi:DUF3530 family protein [Neptunomonas japonica]|uniref:DUF3530 family protein n=1 Tax=Neptunomonas japonica TaxID=417574 RepID=UPI0004254898|nr:DUF3530 family protein [Neptunomonas japonica]
MKTKTYKIYYIFISTLWLVISYSQLSWAQEDPKPVLSKETTNDSSTTQQKQISTTLRSEPNPLASLLDDLSQTQQDADSEIIQLGSGENEFDTFYKESSTAPIHGGAIIFPDDRTHPNWPIITNPLRIGLSNYGWSTLALSLPQTIINANPIRTLPSLKIIRDKPEINEASPQTPSSEGKTPDNQETTSKTSPTPENHKLIMQRGTAAIQALQQKGIKRFVIIGVGTGATWATALATNLQDQTDIKLLIINAQQSQDVSAPTLLDLIPELKTISLDIYSAAPGHTTKLYKKASRLRIETARKSNLNNYHQSRLPQIANQLSGQEWLLRYTRGLLTTYIIKAEEQIINTHPKPAPSINQQPGATRAPKQNPI